MRTTKTRMYEMVAKTRGAEVDNIKLQNLDVSALENGRYDIIVTDIDGKSATDNQKFLNIVEAYAGSLPAGRSLPSIRMFSGSYVKDEVNLPVPIPEILNPVLSTHNALEAITIIPKAITESKQHSIHTGPGAML